MKRRFLGWFVLVLLAMSLALTACQSEPAPADDGPQSAEQPEAPADSGTDAEDSNADTPGDTADAEPEEVEQPPTTPIGVADVAGFGLILVDGEGWTLYIFLNDEPGVSNCSGSCENNWPPLLAEGELAAGEGVDASLLGTTTRDDGTTQLTYNGWPLYYYVDDVNPGDTNGIGVGDVWYPISPAGEQAAAAEEEEEIDY